MEKLERVLIAEEDARQTVARAADEADAVRAAARSEAARIERESAESSRLAVDEAREEVLAGARAEADGLLASAEAERAAAAAIAAQRLDAVTAHLTSIVEG